MITVHLKNHKTITKLDPRNLKDYPASDILWIDLDAPTSEERRAVEDFISMKLVTKAQAEEIESTSKYWETANEIIANCNYFISHDHTYEIEPTSFIITREGLLVSDHHIHPSSFDEVVKRISNPHSNNQDGFGLFITILEVLIDYDADMLELISRQITTLAKDINSSDNIEKEMLRRINRLQEKSMSMRENIFDLQRVISALMRSPRFSGELHERIKMMMKDIDSLISHGEISFERLDYLQDTTLGLINIEQNEVVKILSVAAVIFMPPTLIASIYGMNFKVMPELDWVWNLNNGWIIPAGYLFALALMVVVTVITYLFFRYKKWL